MSTILNHSAAVGMLMDEGYTLSGANGALTRADARVMVAGALMYEREELQRMIARRDERREKAAHVRLHGARVK